MADRDVQFRYNSEQVKAHQATTDPVVSVDTRRGEVVGQFANAGPRPSLVTADAGSPNSYRTRAWKTEVATLSVATGLEITVCHFPPGTSKWNKIEHMLFPTSP